MIDLIKSIARRNRDNSSLGFKKVPFHLGINKFVLEPKSSSKNESQAEFDDLEDNDDGEDPYHYLIPHYLVKFFAELDDFVPRINAMDSASNSSEDTTNSHHT